MKMSIYSYIGKAGGRLDSRSNRLKTLGWSNMRLTHFRTDKYNNRNKMLGGWTQNKEWNRGNRYRLPSHQQDNEGITTENCARKFGKLGKLDHILRNEPHPQITTTHALWNRLIE